jgi:hypothetical protein
MFETLESLRLILPSALNKGELQDNKVAAEIFQTSSQIGIQMKSDGLLICLAG